MRPEEVALSIVAEMKASLSGRDALSLRTGSFPFMADTGSGEIFRSGRCRYSGGGRCISTEWDSKAAP